MGLTDAVFGSPGTTETHQAPGTKPPGFNFARGFFNSLPGLTSGQYPTYQGQLDPGMSPTMMDSLRRAQGYAQSGPPEVLQGVQGMLGQFMSPNFSNPWNSLFGNAPNYGGVDSSQRVYGGGPAQGATFQSGFGGSGQPGGMPGQAPGGGMPGQGPSQFTGQQPQIPGGQSADPRFSFRGAPGAAGGGAPLPGMPPPGQFPGAAPGGASPFSMGSDQAAGALIKQFGGRQNLLNPLQQQYGTGDQFTNGFMHSGDHQAALQQLLGREPTFDEVQKSWRSGSGNIDAARNSYMAEGVPADRRDGWTPQMHDLKTQIDQNGIAKGSQMFDQAGGGGPVMGAPSPQPGMPTPGMPAAPTPGAPGPGDIPPGMGMGAPPPPAPGPPRMIQGRPVTTQNGQEGIVGNGGRFQPIGGGRGGQQPAGPTDRGVAKPVPRPGRPTQGDGRPGRVPNGPTDQGVARRVPGATDRGVAKPIPKPKKKTPPPVELLRGIR